MQCPLSLMNSVKPQMGTLSVGFFFFLSTYFKDLGIRNSRIKLHNYEPEELVLSNNRFSQSQS